MDWDLKSYQMFWLVMWKTRTIVASAWAKTTLNALPMGCWMSAHAWVRDFHIRFWNDCTATVRRRSSIDSTVGEFLCEHERCKDIHHVPVALSIFQIPMWIRHERLSEELHNLFFLGVPVVLSQPHFLNCAEETQNSVEGLNPSHREHDTYLEIEPVWTFSIFVCVVAKFDHLNSPTENASHSERHSVYQ